MTQRPEFLMSMWHHFLYVNEIASICALLSSVLACGPMDPVYQDAGPDAGVTMVCLSGCDIPDSGWITPPVTDAGEDAGPTKACAALYQPCQASTDCCVRNPATPMYCLPRNGETQCCYLNPATGNCY